MHNSEGASTLGMTGFIMLDQNGRVSSSIGSGTDQRIHALATERAWIAEAREKRMKPILLNDKSLTAYLTPVGDALLILLSDAPAAPVMRFLLDVDFAYDIIELLLTDPYDGMVVVDADEKIAFISPVHEKFFDLKPGEAVGKNVRDVIPNTQLPGVLRTGVTEVGKILSLRDGDRVVSRHAVRHDGKIVGAIGRLMFKGPRQVEELAKRVKELEQQVARYEAESSGERHGEQFLDAIIGQSMAVQSVRQQIRKVAPLDVPVLIQGESGTGKELVARALHMMSKRHEGRLVTVNAAALPATLVESELFGYEAGSFTGADRKGRQGKFEQADKGTIFLDEIGDMPMEVQSKLLRVLQDRVVERVGGDKPKRVDFRLCSATNRDLEAFVEQDKFRLDLFYRISPVRILLPTLAERVEDIPLLLHHFVQEMCEKYGRPQMEVDIDVPDFLMGRSWPGNIRQLRHEVERAFVFAENGRLTVDDFSCDGGPAPRRATPSPVKGAGGTGASGNATLKEAVDRLERDLIADALVRYKGNKKRVAEQLGVSRSYLYKKLEEEGLLSTEDDVLQ